MSGGTYPRGRVGILGHRYRRGRRHVSKREGGYAEEGRYPRGRVGMPRGLGIQEGGDGVGRYLGGRGIQEGTPGALYPRGVAGIQE